MSTDPLVDSPFDRYRERLDRPLSRLFRVYGRPRLRWFGLGLMANLVARGASLLPPIVLGAAIDALFSQPGSAYELPMVPAAWIPQADAGQFWFSVAVIAGAFVVTGVAAWVYGVAANLIAHEVMHAVRTDTIEQLQRLDMTFFDTKQTGEVMAVLNNDASNLERFLDNALQNSVRLGAMVLGVAAIQFYLNPQLADVTLVAVPAMVAFTAWFMRRVEPRYAAHRASVGRLNTRLENAISGVELVKTAGTEAHEHERVADASMDYFRRTIRAPAVIRIPTRHEAACRRGVRHHLPGWRLLAAVRPAARAVGLAFDRRLRCLPPSNPALRHPVGRGLEHR